MVDQTQQASAATDDPWPPSTYAWYVVIVLGLSNILSLMDRMVVAFLIGPIGKELVLSDTMASLLIGAAFTIFYCFMGLPIARLADSKSRKYIIMAGVSFWSLMTALCGAAGNFVQFFLARMGVGVGSATLSPSAYSIMADYFPPQKLALPVGVFSAGVSVGMGLAFIGGGAAIAWVSGLGDVTLPLFGTVGGWRLVLIIMGAIGIPFVIMYLFVKEPVRRGVKQDKDAVPFSEVKAYLLENWKIYLLIMGGYGATSISIYGIMSWTTSFYERVHGVGMAEAGFLIGSAALIGGLIGALAGGWLSDWLEARGDTNAKARVLWYGCMGLIAPGILAPLMPTAQLAAICLGFSFFFGTICAGPTGSLIQVITPNRMRAQMGALYQLSLNLVGLGLGPTFVAVMTDFVFGDKMMVGYSMISSVVIFDGLAVVLTYLAFKHYPSVRDQLQASMAKV